MNFSCKSRFAVCYLNHRGIHDYNVMYATLTTITKEVVVAYLVPHPKFKPMTS